MWVVLTTRVCKRELRKMSLLSVTLCDYKGSVLLLGIEKATISWTGIPTLFCLKGRVINFISSKSARLTENKQRDAYQIIITNLIYLFWIMWFKPENYTCAIAVCFLRSDIFPPTSICAHFLLPCLGNHSSLIFECNSSDDVFEHCFYRN